MELEWASDASEEEGWPVPLVRPEGPHGAHAPWLVADWRPALEALLAELSRGVATGTLASRFHDTLARLIVDAARRAGEERVVLTGGCFQNRILTERAVTRLRATGFKAHWHQRVPPNDGGLALGQAVLALRADG
jgi:hydrogenase maturation protein HypF